MTAEIGWVGLAWSLLLVGVAIALSWWRGLGLARSLVWTSARCIGQLLAIGVALDLVLGAERPLVWAWLWVLAMNVVAAETVRRRAPDLPGLFPLALAAFGAAAVLSLGVVFGLGVLQLEARSLIPVAGLLFGNSLAATVLVVRRIVEEVRDKRDEVEARLALGQPAREASRPYVRNALRTAMIPQIETTKVVGLVVLPGTMTGLVLAGVDPVDAVRVQAAVMFLVLGAVATTTTVMVLGATRRLFTSDHRLVPLPQ